MPKSTDNIHKMHRQRLRKRFLREGIDSFEPHNILELLLFYSISQKDTNCLAHSLINRFGSIEAVFDADIKELEKVDGIGEQSAFLIKLIPQISKYYLSLKTCDKAQFSSLNEVVEFLQERYLFEPREVFTALYLDSAGKLISFDKIAEGTVNSVNISIAKVMEITLPKNAASVIVAHNHPSGNLQPSTADLHATNHLSEAFSILKISFIDHLIITPTDYISMAKDTKYSRYFKQK